ncbi:MAG: 4-alpha-glucanotransferase [Polyangiales bacterium]
MSNPTARRVAGVTVPLFSLRTEGSWGIGEIGDLPRFARWLRAAGVRLIQLLPLGEIAGGETSPYSALTAFGIDPMYLSMGALDDLPAAELPALVGDDGMRTIAWLCEQPKVEYEAVRWLKKKALDAAFVRFRTNVVGSGSPREQDFAAFTREHAAWLDDYALFRALKDALGQRAWLEWPPGVRERNPEALTNARAELADGVLKHQWLQWLAHRQWEAARAELRAMDVEVMGDLPFMVGGDSADVWANRHDFRGDASVGVPGDQFDPEGQEWGLPPYDWRVMRTNGFVWLRRRARYAGVLYDRFRIDHLVGFYRTYMRPVDRLRGPDNKLLPGFFDPSEEPAQLAHGEAVIGAMVAAAKDTGAALVAEDLGVIPDYVRPSLTRMGVPGYKVLIWEQRDGAFHDPAGYPSLSVACLGTHDTAAVATWWRELPAHERAAVCRLPVMAARGGEGLGTTYTPAVQAALTAQALAAGSSLALLMIQDVLGVDVRINTPGTVGPHNWTWRLPKTVEALADDEGAKAALASLAAEIKGAGR